MNSSFRPAHSKLNAFHQEHVHIKGLCKRAVWGVNFCSAWFKRSSSEKGATVGIRTDRWQTFQNQIVKFFTLFPNCDQIVKVQTMLSTCQFQLKVNNLFPPSTELVASKVFGSNPNYILFHILEIKIVLSRRNSNCFMEMGKIDF